METNLLCGLCRYGGSDIRIGGCGCTLHARCVPVGLVATAMITQVADDRSLVPVKPNTVLCPLCHSAPVTSMELFPLSIENLDRAVEIRKKAGKSKIMKDAKKGKKDVDPGFCEIQAEASYLLLAHNHNQGLMNGLSAENEHQRTGRWTDDEVSFVDFLLDAFDKGKLPMAQGVRLNDFLCEMLLCKSSRLTKKMKNARLSIRSYDIHNRNPESKLDVEMLSTLQEKFLRSLVNEATQLEVRFNICKAWRVHFSNFCLQVGCSMLDAGNWISSLEDMERRAAQAEETIRKARRRMIAKALRTDLPNAPTNGVFWKGMEVKPPGAAMTTDTQGMVPSRKRHHENPQRRPGFPEPEAAESAGSSTSQTPNSSSDSSRKSDGSVGNSSDEGSESEFINTMLDLPTTNKLAPNLPEDFSTIFTDLMENAGMPTGGEHRSSPGLRNNCGSFLEEIVSYMETNRLPFQHVDVWVPSWTSKGRSGAGELRLHHAGHATRSDLDSTLFYQLHEYGEYSTRYSFAPGVGLPGRVYKTGEFTWERRIDLADPKVFERAGGAKVYGVKTGFGIPLKTSEVFRIVVAMYATEDLNEDLDIVRRCTADLSSYCPEPKWKLVVEMKSSDNESTVGQGTFPANSSNQQRPATGTGSGAEAIVPPSAIGGRPLPTDGSDEDLHIATILGDHMPLNELPAPGESTSSFASPNLLAKDFMELRFLLLRPPARRTMKDVEDLEVIRKSYRGYSKDSKRSDRDLAHFLVRDYIHLRALSSTEPLKRAATTTSTTPAPQASPTRSSEEIHQCHVMKAPAVSTYAPNGVPTRMPSNLALQDPAMLGVGSSKFRLENANLVSNVTTMGLSTTDYNIAKQRSLDDHKPRNQSNEEQLGFCDHLSKKRRLVPPNVAIEALTLEDTGGIGGA